MDKSTMNLYQLRGNGAFDLKAPLLCAEPTILISLPQVTMGLDGMT